MQKVTLIRLVEATRRAGRKGAMMTVPLERSRAVLGACELLTELATVRDDATLAVFRERARVLLRHYPERIHLRISAAVAPEIWADPDAGWLD